MDHTQDFPCGKVPLYAGFGWLDDLGYGVRDCEFVGGGGFGVVVRVVGKFLDAASCAVQS
jgi:hypothetical protein